MDYRNHDLKELRGGIVTSNTSEKGELLSKTYHDVTLLAAGTWIDSKSRQKIEYPKKTLEKYAKNWANNRLSVDHNHGVLGTIGYVSNQYYKDGRVMGDITIKTNTQIARDVMALIDDGQINAVSTEVETVDSYDKKTDSYKATELKFWGQSVVTQGACDVCTLSLFEMNKNIEYELEEIKHQMNHHADDGGVIWNNVIREMEDVLIGDQIPHKQRKEIYDDLKKHYIERGKEAPKFHNIIECEGTFIDEVSGIWADERKKLTDLLYYKEDFMIENIEETESKEVKKLEESKEEKIEIKELSIDELAREHECIRTLIDENTTCATSTKELQANIDEKTEQIIKLEARIKELEETKIQKTRGEHAAESVYIEPEFIWDGKTSVPNPYYKG